MARGMNVSTLVYLLNWYSQSVVSTARQIAAWFHPKDGKSIHLDNSYDKPLITMYQQYADKLVEETREWRRLMALQAHYADMIDKLEHMDKGEMEGTQGATDHLEDLHPSML